MTQLKFEFIWTDPHPLMTKRHKGELTTDKYPALILHVDGGCQPVNPGGVTTCGWALFDPKNPKKALFEEGRVVERDGPKSTNNVGEYSAVVYSMLYIVLQPWRGELTIKSDSKLLVEQLNGRWKINAEHLKDLNRIVRDLIDRCGFHIITESDPLPPEGKLPCQIIWIPREENEVADRMCNLAYEKYIARSKTCVEEE